MMDAVFSGSSGIALLVHDDGRMESFHTDDHDVLTPREEYEFHLLFGETSNLKILQNTDRETVAQQLQFARDCDVALQIFLFVLDPLLDTYDRIEYAAVLEEFLQNKSVTIYLESVFYAHTIPETVDLPEAIKICNRDDLKNTHLFLDNLNRLQPKINQVRNAWLAIPFNLIEKEDYNNIQSQFVKLGLFRNFILALENHEKINNFFLECCKNPKVTTIRNHRDILLSWIESFKSEHQSSKNKNIDDLKDSRVSEKCDEKKNRYKEHDGGRKGTSEYMNHGTGEHPDIAIEICPKHQLLVLVRQMVNAFAENIGLSKEDTLQLVLCVDEACANSIQTVQEIGSENPAEKIRLEIKVQPESLHMTIIDRGKDFTHSLQKAGSLSDDSDRTKKRGYGLQIIKTFMDEVEYVHEPGSGNKLSLMKRISVTTTESV